MSKEMEDTTNIRDPIAEGRRQWMAHGWEDSATGMAAVTTIVRVNQILVAMVEEALAPFGLTFARFEILRLLGFTRSGQLPMGKIGERLQVHPASVTSAVKRLERDGLIRREVSAQDNRVVLAVLIPHGQKVLNEATSRINRFFRSLAVDDTRLDEMVGLLNLIRQSAGDEVDGRAG